MDRENTEFFIDVTERRQIENDFRFNSETLKLALKSSQMGVWQCDIKNRKRIYDDQCCYLLGIDPVTFRGTEEEFILRVHPEDRPRLLATLTEAINSNAPYEVDFRVPWPDGTMHYLASRGSLFCNEKGKSQFLNGIVWDITDRIKAQESLRISEEKYRSIVGNISVGVTLINPDMEILSLNNYMQKAYPHIDLENKNICYRSLNTPPKDEICTDCPAAKTFKDGLVHEHTKEIIKEDKSYNYRIISSPIKDKSGKVIAAIEMIEDMTSQVLAQNLLKESERKSKEFSRKLLAVREEEKKNVSLNLHDEIGTIALFLNAQLSIIESDLEKKNYKNVLKGVRKAKVDFKKEIVNLKKIVEELRPPNLDLVGLSGILKEKFDKRQQEGGLEIRFKDKLGKIKLSDQIAISLYRVTQEAFTNIIKHAQAKSVVVELSYKDNKINFSINDDGRGFDMNHPLKNSKELNFGLQGMRERIEALGGSFMIESTLKKGTTLRITIPFSNEGESKP